MSDAHTTVGGIGRFMEAHGSTVSDEKFSIPLTFLWVVCIAGCEGDAKLFVTASQFLLREQYQLMGAPDSFQKLH